MRLCFAVLALILTPVVAHAADPQPATPVAASPSTRPRLVVLLAVDQMRDDYIEQYGSTWKHGLRRLLAEGARFSNANYPYLATVTCPGHTTIGTGAYPRTHGMILNGWWDRQTKRLIDCTDDPGSPLVFYGAGRSSDGDSGKNIMVPSLADEMKTQLSPKPRAVSFSQKARASVGLVGRNPDAATWLEAGKWVTARSFSSAPIPWLEKALAANPREPQLEKPWEKFMDAAAYKYADEAKEEKAPSGWTRSFPHALRGSNPGFGFWEKSPAADAYLTYLGGAAVDALGLGKKDSIDFLSLSYSVLDLVGHAFGPRSHEVQDVLARLDVTLGDLFSHLDKAVGKGNYVVALSADHGVAVIPEQAQGEGKDAGRTSSTDLKKRLNEAVVVEVGEGSHVVQILGTDLYLSPGVFDKLVAKPGAVDRVLTAVRGAPGILAAWGTNQLRDLSVITDPLQKAAALSHYPGRSGDIICAQKPNWIMGSIGTTHGTTHGYDTHVPVLLFGAGIKPGTYSRPVSPADMAPTLAKLIGVKLSKAEGQPLVEALASDETKAAPAKPVKRKKKR